MTNEVNFHDESTEIREGKEVVFRKNIVVYNVISMEEISEFQTRKLLVKPTLITYILLLLTMTVVSVFTGEPKYFELYIKWCTPIVGTVLMYYFVRKRKTTSKS